METVTEQAGSLAPEITPEMINAGVRCAIDYCGMGADMSEGEVRLCVNEILKAGLVCRPADDASLRDLLGRAAGASSAMFQGGGFLKIIALEGNEQTACIPADLKTILNEIAAAYEEAFKVIEALGERLIDATGIQPIEEGSASISDDRSIAAPAQNEPGYLWEMRGRIEFDCTVQPPAITGCVEFREEGF